MTFVGHVKDDIFLPEGSIFSIQVSETVEACHFRRDFSNSFYTHDTIRHCYLSNNSLIMRPPLIRKLHDPHYISALPLVAKPRHAAQMHVDRLQVGVGVAHEGLAQIVDAVPHVARRRVAAVLRLDPVPGGIVTPADGV